MSASTSIVGQLKNSSAKGNMRARNVGASIIPVRFVQLVFSTMGLLIDF